jgi:hypothetical protein
MAAGDKPDVVLPGKKYQQIEMPTADSIVSNDYFNDSCIVRFFLAGIGGT